jgi:hypothetical protein
VSALSVVAFLDLCPDGELGVSPRWSDAAEVELGLQRCEERICHRIVPTHPGAPSRPGDPVRFRKDRQLLRFVLGPLSVRKITLPANLPRRVVAIVRASSTGSARIWSSMAQPIARSERASITVARCCRPSCYWDTNDHWPSPVTSITDGPAIQRIGPEYAPISLTRAS